MTVMQHIHEAGWRLFIAAVAVVVVLSLAVKSCSTTPAPAGPPASSASSASAPASATAGAIKQVFPGCPRIPLSASSSAMRAVMAQCARAADATAARTEARLAAQSESAAAAPLSTAAAAHHPPSGAVASLPSPAKPQPPTGVAQGWIARQTYGIDQYQEWIATSPATAVHTATADFSAAALNGTDPPRRTTYTGWIDLTHPASVAALDAAGGEGAVSASIDQWPMGSTVARDRYSAPTTQRATLALAAGWHRLTVTIEQQPDHWTGSTGDLHVRAQVGDADALETPAVYALPPASSAAPMPSAPPKGHRSIPTGQEPVGSTNKEAN